MPAFRQSLFRQNSLNQDSPKFNNAKVSGFTVPFTEIHLAVSLRVPYKVLPFSEIILKRMSFSSYPPPSYSFHTVVGLCESPGQILYLNIHLFVS